jgi:hypothetical protein
MACLCVCVCVCVCVFLNSSHGYQDIRLGGPSLEPRPNAFHGSTAVGRSCVLSLGRGE